MNEFLTWDYLLTFGGCVLGTGIITQFLKKLKWAEAIGTQVISYIVALVILVIAQAATGTFTWQLFALDLFNAVVVSFASNGAYDAIDRIVSKTNNNNFV